MSQPMRPLFKDRDRLRPVLRDTPIALFLDFDGTLAPIVEEPGRASMGSKTRETLLLLSKVKGLRAAVISGRSLADIKERVGIRGIAYAGNHGLELEGPGFCYRPRIPSSFRGTLTALRETLKGLVSPYPGARIEDKGLSLTLHFRNVKTRNVFRIRAVFRETVAPLIQRGDVKVRSGKKVLEVRPPVDWDKGHAVRWLLRRRKWMPSAARRTIIYVGDDRTDEDAFRVLRPGGITIRVGRVSRTYAKYFLPGVDEVATFLKSLYEIRKADS
jgi:trehalose 6-phosphate phosphatase